MSEAPKFTSGDWNPFESLRAKTNKGSQLQGHGIMTGRHLKNAMALQAQHHKNVMEYQSEGYRLEGRHQETLAGLSEKAATGEHSRTLELHGAIQKAAEPGTGVKAAFPSGMAVEYTTRKPKVRKPKPSATPNFPPVKVAEEPQQEAPAAPATPVAKSGPSVKRDPKTGQAVSLNPNKAKKAVPKKKR